MNEKPAYFIETGIRRFYDENGTFIKEEAYDRLFKCNYPEEKEKENDDSTESK